MNNKENVKEGHKERLEAIKNWRRTTYVKMAEETNVSLGTFRQIIAGYLNISVRTATALANTYAGLNVNWILTGEGTMLNNADMPKEESYDGWSADQLKCVVKSQSARIEELKETIAVMREQISMLKEKMAQIQMVAALTEDYSLDPTE